MADGDGATIYVYFFGVETQLARHGNCRGGEGFVELDWSHILVALPAGFAEEFFDGVNGGHHHPLGFDATDGLSNDERNRFFAWRLGGAVAAARLRGGAVVGGGRVACGDCSILFECGL